VTLLGSISPRACLLVDSGGGLLVGVGVLALSGWLAPLYGLPIDVVRFLGVCNLAYGSFSGSILLLSPPPRLVATRALVIANGAWPLVCVALGLAFRDVIGLLGAAALVGEGVYVGGLALVERRVLLGGRPVG
jgi:hypothetical protein